MKQTVLITGAALRIGRAITEHLALRGWDVIVHAHRSTAEADALCAQLRADGHSAWRVGGDLAEEDGADAVFDAAVRAAGRVDALVNNAACFRRQPLADATVDDFEHLWRLNALTPMRLTQRLARHLSERGASGCAVQLLDQRIAGAAAPGIAPYLISKKALEAFTLSAALEFAPSLRVNAVAPGAVLAPVSHDAREPAGAFPLGARPTPEHVAEAVAYLLGARSVTGQILFVDGGQHVLSQPFTPSQGNKT